LHGHDSTTGQSLSTIRRIGAITRG
jgi:hypothetical protein